MLGILLSANAGEPVSWSSSHCREVQGLTNCQMGKVNVDLSLVHTLWTVSIHMIDTDLEKRTSPLKSLCIFSRLGLLVKKNNNEINQGNAYGMPVKIGRMN